MPIKLENLKLSINNFLIVLVDFRKISKISKIFSLYFSKLLFRNFEKSFRKIGIFENFRKFLEIKRYMKHAFLMRKN